LPIACKGGGAANLPPVINEVAQSVRIDKSLISNRGGVFEMLNIFLIGKKIIRGLNNSCMSENKQRAKSGMYKYRKIKRKKY
jgi:hypothetical protein